MATKRSLVWGALSLVLGVLFLLDLGIPDILPLVDEALAGLATLLAAWQAIKGWRKPEKGQRDKVVTDLVKDGDCWRAPEKGRAEAGPPAKTEK